jgi:hypothetical protein
VLCEFSAMKASRSDSRYLTHRPIFEYGILGVPKDRQLASVLGVTLRCLAACSGGTKFCLFVIIHLNERGGMPSSR